MEHSPQSTGIPKMHRRRYSAEFKASVVQQCSHSGASIAAIAHSHGIHASLLRRWVRLMRQPEPATVAMPTTPHVPPPVATTPSAQCTPVAAPSTPSVGLTAAQAGEQTAPAQQSGFIPIATASPAWPGALQPPASEAIHIQLHSDSAQVHIRWPTSAAAQCAQWMRDGLATVLGPPQPNSNPPDNLPLNTPPPDGEGLPRSKPSPPALRRAR